jgi:hypothetical protein
MTGVAAARRGSARASANVAGKVDVGGPAQKMPMTAKPFLTILIYSTRCEYVILNVLLKKMTRTHPLVPSNMRNGIYTGLVIGFCWFLQSYVTCGDSIEVLY